MQVCYFFYLCVIGSNSIRVSSLPFHRSRAIPVLCRWLNPNAPTFRWQRDTTWHRVVSRLHTYILSEPLNCWKTAKERLANWRVHVGYMSGIFALCLVYSLPMFLGCPLQVRKWHSISGCFALVYYCIQLYSRVGSFTQTWRLGLFAQCDRE